MLTEYIDRAVAPPVHEMHHLQLPVPQVEKLANGIDFYLLKGGSQEVLQLSFTWQGGTYEARVPAIAKLTAQLMPEGTTTRTGAQISEELDFHGTILRIVSEHHTTTLTVSALSNMVSDVLPIIEDVICNPVFDTNKFETFKDMEVQNLLLAQSKVSVLASEALDSLIKGRSHPAAKVPTVDEVQSITVDDIKDFYGRLVTTDKCMAFLSGNFTDEICAKVKEMAESLPRRADAMEMVVVPFSPEVPQTVTVDKPDAVQAAINIGIPAPSRSHPDYIPLRFATMALGGYFGSRLMKNIREDKGYTYGITSFLLGNRGGSYITVAAETDKSYVVDVIREIKKEINVLATVPMDRDELMRLRQHISVSLMEILDSPFAIMEHYKVIKSVGLPEGYFEHQVECVKNLSPEMVMEMAQKYMLADEMRIAVCE